MAAPTSIRSHIMDPLLNFKFVVSWGIAPSTPKAVPAGDFKVVAGVSKVGPLARSTEVAEYREGGAAQSTRKIPGQTKYDEFSIERGIILDIEFEQWANKVWYYQQTELLGNQLALLDFRKTLKIDLCNQSGQIMNTYYVFNCWPSKYTILPELNGGDGATVALESMTLQTEGWARDPDPKIEPPKYPSFALPATPNIEGVDESGALA